MKLIDIGINFHSKQLAAHTPELLARARAAGVLTMLATGTSLKASQHAVSLAEQHVDVLATAGVHPHEASRWDLETSQAMKALWSHQRVVAVGETGLDYNRMFSPMAAQRAAFAAQIEGAHTTSLPLFLHCRDAFSDFEPMLRDAASAGVTGVVHCFTGTWEEAERLLALGFDIGVTGWITDTARGSSLREVAARMPLDRLHLETDAPYLRPKTAPKTERYNEPALLPYVAAEIATLRGDISPEALAAQCTLNSIRLFKLAV